MQSAAPISRPSLLLVDDRADNLVSLEAILADGERTIITATNGEHALSVMLKQDVTLVLLDVQMPDMDGYEVAKLMRVNPRTREIPIIFVTATQPDDRSTVRGYESGAIDYIYKPYNVDVLRKKVAVLQELQLSRKRLSFLNRNLDEARTYYAAILSTAAEGILVTDEQGVVSYANPTACELLNCKLIQLEGESIQKLTTEPNSNVVPWENGVFFQHWQNKRTYRAHDTHIYTPNGQRLPVTISCAPLPAPHRGLVVVFLDNRVPKQLQEQLLKQAVTDTLTGLFNRHGFLQALQTALSRSQRNNKPMALLYLDLDGFKRVNDTLGHPCGDQLLRVMADRLRRSTRAYDVVGRLGGDEFTVILDSLDTPEDAARIAEKMLESIITPVELQGLQLSVSASIGIATFPDKSDADGLMQAADMAMYQAKAEGRNQYRFFTAEMNGRARARLMLEESLRQAVATEEFELHYQPQIHLGNGKLRGFEALLRWQHHQAGAVSPSIFVPLLEETGLINRIGGWVIEQACKQRVDWQSRFPADVVISANLSARQFGVHELAQQIFRLLDRYRLPPSQLELEVTESSLMHDITHSQNVLQALRKEGVRIAIDDFGTGYSSLAYLRQLEIDTLKIDRSFIVNALVSEKDAVIVESVISLSRKLNIEVIAEGVETLEQLQWLQQAGCDCVQGFFFAKPLPEKQATQFPAHIPIPQAD